MSSAEQAKRVVKVNVNHCSCYVWLTLKVLSKIVADNILIYYQFSEKVRLGMSCESSARQMKCQALISPENKKKKKNNNKNIKRSSAALLLVLKGNLLILRLDRAVNVTPSQIPTLLAEIALVPHSIVLSNQAKFYLYVILLIIPFNFICLMTMLWET